MSAYDDIIAWTRGKSGWMADMIAFATKTRDDIAALVGGGLTSALVFGAREITSAVDISLLAADSHVQAVTMSAASKAVIMPDATGDVEGRGWQIQNAGATPFAIKDDSGGTLVATLSGGCTANVYLIDDATPAGVWEVYATQGGLSKDDTPSFAGVTTTAQNLAANGSTGAPAYSFSGSTGVGLLLSSTNVLGLATSGLERFKIASGGPLTSILNGSAAAPQYTFNGSTGAGLYLISANILGLSTAASERLRVGPGLTMVAATGGDKGAGTINATAVYDDGTLLTCYVPLAAQGGKLLDADWDVFAPDQVIPGTPEYARQVSKEVEVEKTVIEIVDGIPVQKTVLGREDALKTIAKGVVDEAGDPVMVEVAPAVKARPVLYDNDGNQIAPAITAKKAVMEPLMLDVPVMEVVPATADQIIKRQHTGMKKFRDRLGGPEDPLDIDKYAAHWKTKGHLTSMPNRDNYDPVNGQLSTGESIQRLVEAVEIQAVLIEQLNARLKILEPPP